MEMADGSVKRVDKVAKGDLDVHHAQHLNALSARLTAPEVSG